MENRDEKDKFNSRKINLSVLFVNIMPKLHVDICCLLLRILTILIWVGALMQGRKLSVAIQTVFVGVIFITDAMDGMISRRFSTERQKYYFRILDAFVDKVSMLFFLLVLFFLHYFELPLLICIIAYNVVLTLPVIIKILCSTEKKLSWIQATLISRLYAMSVGIFCFLVLNIDFVKEYQNISFLYFVILGILSLFSHLIKIKKNAR